VPTSVPVSYNLKVQTIIIKLKHIKLQLVYVKEFAARKINVHPLANHTVQFHSKWEERTAMFVQCLCLKIAMPQPQRSIAPKIILI